MLGVIPRLRNYTTTIRYIDVAWNLVSYYDCSRTFVFDCDRTSDIKAYQDAVRGRKDEDPRIAVVTAIIGPFDALLIPELLEKSVDYFCFSDLIDDGYGVFRIKRPPYIDADPRRTARYIKANLPKLFPDYDFVVWVDANVLIRCGVEIFAAFTEAAGCAVGVIPHPIRASYAQEAEEVRALGLDVDDLIQAQLDRYGNVAELQAEQLIETNFMVLDVRQSEVREFTRLWWNEINTYSRRDQLSVNYALLKAGVKWKPLLQESHSVRDTAVFALFEHGLNEWGPKPSIYASWYTPGSLEWSPTSAAGAQGVGNFLNNQARYRRRHMRAQRARRRPYMPRLCGSSLEWPRRNRARG